MTPQKSNVNPDLDLPQLSTIGDLGQGPILDYSLLSSLQVQYKVEKINFVGI